MDSATAPWHPVNPPVHYNMDDMVHVMSGNPDAVFGAHPVTQGYIYEGVGRVLAREGDGTRYNTFYTVAMLSGTRRGTRLYRGPN